MKIEVVETSVKHKYKIITLGEAKKNLEDMFMTLYVPDIATDDTKGFLLTVKDGLQFNIIEE